MRTFFNRLRDRGWKNSNMRGLTNNDNQVLRRGNKCIVGVENICVDTSVDLIPQIEELFQSLIETIQRADAKEIFLPGGGDITMPNFFINYCVEHNISIHILTIESFQEFLNYN